MQDDTGIAVYRWDAADFEECSEGLGRMTQALGPVEILVNNAGITADAGFHRMSRERWWRVVRANLGSVFNMSRLVIEGMRDRRFGRIVNISSINGRKGQAGQCNYAAAKAGILGFTKSLALENAGHGITVNAVAGFITGATFDVNGGQYLA